MSSTPRNRFSGQPTSGLFEGQNNSIFFSPALLESRQGNEIEVESISVALKNNDVYSQPTEEDTRLFLFGPHSSSRTGNRAFRTMYKRATVIGTLVQVTPPGPTTVFKIR